MSEVYYSQACAHKMVLKIVLLLSVGYLISCRLGVPLKVELEVYMRLAKIKVFHPELKIQEDKTIKVIVTAENQY